MAHWHLAGGYAPALETGLWGGPSAGPSGTSVLTKSWPEGRGKLVVQGAGASWLCRQLAIQKEANCIHRLGYSIYSYRLKYSIYTVIPCYNNVIWAALEYCYKEDITITRLAIGKPKVGLILQVYQPKPTCDRFLQDI